ncbi:MAG TPA: YafY family protein [Spirochaetales bacterium]|nr:YafY family protein [Spirochaetales bacterium]
MKHERLIAILDCLLNEGKKTAAELAGRFEVSERTIYRDIDSLCMAGVPVVAEPGSGGGFEMDPSYRVDRSFLTRDEIADLSTLLRGMPEALKDGHIERSLGKLSSLGAGAADRARRDEANGLPPPFIATLSPWGSPGPDPMTVLSLRGAIADRALVSFQYVDGEGKPSERVVEPFSIVFGGGVWYLHGFCRLRSAWRIFKLSRVRSLRRWMERFDPSARLPVPDPFRSGNEPLVDVELEAAASLVQTLDEAFPGCRAGERPDGSAVFAFKYPEGAWLVRFLLSVGPGLVVRKPESVRAAVAKAAMEIAEANEAP